jgi:hypothetical protein
MQNNGFGKVGVSSILTCSLLILAGCGAIIKPLANVGVKQPGQGLYELAVRAKERGRSHEALILSETLVASYPDSRYVTSAEQLIRDLGIEEQGCNQCMTFFPGLVEDTTSGGRDSTVKSPRN